MHKSSCQEVVPASSHARSHTCGGSIRSLRILLPTLLVAMSSLATAACSGSSTAIGPDERIQLDDGEVAGPGTIRHTQSFGGFWYLEAKDGATYLPLTLRNEFRRDRLRVTFVGRLRPDISTTVMVGRVVELSSVVPR